MIVKLSTKWQTMASVCFLVIALGRLMAQGPDEPKQWQFTLPHGTMHIYQFMDRDGESWLSIGPVGSEVNTAPITEQAEPLSKVLMEMESLGQDPRKITFIGTRTFGHDVDEKLAYACADSKEWSERVRTNRWHTQEGMRLVVSLLNQSGVYEPYNQAFKKYGIRATVTEVECKGLITVPDLRPRYPKDPANPKLKIPYCYVGMRFSPIDAPNTKGKE